MKTILSLAFRGATWAFAPVARTKVSTELNLERREVLVTGVLGVLGAPVIANAKSPSAASTFFFDDQIDKVREPAQMATGGKLDLNANFVGDYKVLPGMYPSAAGKIASNGPYNEVKDIYKIPGLTANDIKLFKKYEKEFTVNPPGRAFDERINARVST